MKTAAIALSLIGAVLSPAALARAEPARSWPRISEAADEAACRQPLMVATLAFGSTASKPADAAPILFPDKQPASGVLVAPEAGGSDDGGFIVDDTAIERHELSAGLLRAVLLQRTPAGGFRFVVSQQKMNWQGDWYGLYAADVSLSGEKLAELLEDEKQTAAKAAFEQAWQRPWLIRDAQTSQVTGIDTQHPAGFLEDWIVFRIEAGAPVVACRISFRPPAKRATQLLPDGALRQFAALIDAILGMPARNEGTLQPTARVRIAAAQAWANAALRPWAVAEPYNTPTEVERSLKAWSAKSAAYRTQYARMQALYPQALRALATLYQTRFGKPPAEATTLAKQVLDRAVGTHFVFPKGG